MLERIRLQLSFVGLGERGLGWRIVWIEIVRCCLRSRNGCVSLRYPMVDVDFSGLALRRGITMLDSAVAAKQRC